MLCPCTLPYPEFLALFQLQENKKTGEKRREKNSFPCPEYSTVSRPNAESEWCVTLCDTQNWVLLKGVKGTLT